MRLRGGGASSALVLALCLAALPGAATAQDETRVRECRCVDRDGNEIESCTCFRTPRFEDVLVAAEGWDDRRARIGVTLDPNQGRDVDLEGAEVRDVLEGGPAEEAGIRPGDVITSIAGHMLSRPLDAEVEADFNLDRSIPVQRLLALGRELEEGQAVEVEYLRDGERRTATVTAEEIEERFGRVRLNAWEPERLALLGRELRGNALREGPSVYRFRSGDSDFFVGRSGRFNHCPSGSGDHVLAFGDSCVGGLELVELNRELGTYFGATEGVLVTKVHEESPTGLEPGDVILAIGDRAVDSPERARRILSSYAGDEDVHFRIMRDRTEMSVSGRLGT